MASQLCQRFEMVAYLFADDVRNCAGISLAPRWPFTAGFTVWIGALTAGGKPFTRNGTAIDLERVNGS